MDPIYKDMERIYGQIQSEARPEQIIMQAITCPVFVYHKTAEKFHGALNRYAEQLNMQFGEDISVRYEGGLRWSMLGTVRCEWLEFELLTAKSFLVSKNLRGSMTAKFQIRKQGKDGRELELDIRNAIAAIALRSKRRRVSLGSSEKSNRV